MKSNQTRNDLNYHIIFSTKNRKAILTIEHFCQMREWAKEKAMEIGILIHALNGYKDHVHILLSIPPKLSVSYTVMRIKGYLSYKMPDVYWQEGYAVYVVESKNFNRIAEYIHRQKEHHESGIDDIGIAA